jgi:hypothetical protein
MECFFLVQTGVLHHSDDVRTTQCLENFKSVGRGSPTDDTVGSSIYVFTSTKPNVQIGQTHLWFREPSLQLFRVLLTPKPERSHWYMAHSNIPTQIH